jgi:RNA polymerase sigma-70 factor, ECF subfamily
VPRELAPKLFDLLRQHFRDDPAVEVITERRDAERRRRGERRGQPARANAEDDRRRVRSQHGRRVADRRAAAVQLDAPWPALPRKARQHAPALRFIERLEPSRERAEDVDTARLVHRFQAGESDVFALLYMRYFDRVYSYLRAVLNDPHEAEDAAQQVFTGLLRSLQSYERRQQPFRAWLFVIVRNQALNLLRDRSRIKTEDPLELAERREQGTENAELPVLDWMLDTELTMFIERLPSAQRQVLLMRFMLDLTTSEIAQILGRAPADVRKLQHRALMYLRDRLSVLGRAPRREPRRGAYHRPRQAVVLRERRFALRA